MLSRPTVVGDLLYKTLVANIDVQGLYEIYCRTVDARRSLQVLCGRCHSFSGHLYEVLGPSLGYWDGMTMTRDFCNEYTSKCEGEIHFPIYGTVSYCDKHVGSSDEDADGLYWSYPYTEGDAWYCFFP